MELSAERTSILQIIHKYVGYQQMHSLTTDARIELLGGICATVAPEQLSPRLKEVLSFYPYCQKILTKEEAQTLLSNKEIVADILCSGSEYVGRNGNYALMQPVGLTRMAVAALHGLKKGSIVYNPFAGTNSYAIAAPQYRFEGEEINTLTWAIGQMRMIIHGVKADISEGNSQKVRRKRKYDAIITTPSFGFQENLDYLARLYDMLNEKGRLVFISPVGVLFNTHVALAFRNRLIEEKALSTIIQLPSRMFDETGIATALVVVDKAPHETIRMIDATTCAQRDGRSLSLSDNTIDEICDIIQDSGKTVDYCIDVPFDAIWRKKDRSLLPSVYIADKKLEDRHLKNMVPLRGLLELYVEPYRGRGKVREVKTRDLSNNVLLPYKNFLDLPLQEVESYSCLLDEDNLLLLPIIGNNLRPTIFRKTEGATVVVKRNSIYVFRLVSHLVSLEYIVSELSKEYVQEQLSAAYTGTYIARVTADRLLDVQISIPSLSHQNKEEEQKSITEQQIEYQNAMLEKAGIQVQQLQDQQRNKFLSLMHQRKHALGQVLNYVEPGMDLLRKTLKNNDGVLRASDIVSKRSGMTVEEYLENIHAQISKMINIVDCLVDDTEFSSPQYIPVYQSLIQFGQTLMQDKFQYNVFYLSDKGFHVRISDATKKSLKHHTEYKVSFGEEEFTQLLDNIISNGIKHGFSDTSKEYVFLVYISHTTLNGQEAIAIHIANNGDSLPKGMTPEKVFAPNETSGDGEGLGGWHAKNIVEYYGGEISFRESGSSDCTVEYVITLPIVDSYEV